MNIVEFQDLSADDKQLVLACKEAQSLAYAPYSNFYVGTAIRMESGAIMKGANQENASYPLCLCAERVALSYAAMDKPGEEITAIAVSTSAKLSAEDRPAPPCGACRQVLLEYQNRQTNPFRIILLGYNDQCWIFDSIEPLLPYSFSKSFFS